MNKYFVTFCAFDHTVEANPLWHGSFILSKLDEKKQLMQVVDTWGFYGVPSTGDRNTWLSKLKIKIGLDIDLQGNHGFLKHEEVRYMDLGHGLHGYTFELTDEKFKLLQQRCVNAVADQEAAIHEVFANHDVKSNPTKKIRLYKEEEYSRQIYEIEQIKAKNEGRPSRLKPFEFRVSLGFFGPSFEKSHTCKTEAISLLEGILSEKQLAPFKSSSFPRFIPGMESLLLHSTGTLHTHNKSSGKTVYYRDKLKDDDVALYWSVPPQRFDALSDETINLLSIDNEYVPEVKHLVGQLQKLEWLIRNAVLPRKYQAYQEDLIGKIIDHYKAFAIIEPKSETKISGWYGFGLSILSAPRSSEEKKLQDKIKNAKMLLNSLYMSVVDGWQIDDKYPSESEKDFDVNEDYDYNCLEALASYLSVEDKKNLCHIVGRSYLETDEQDLEEASLMSRSFNS